MSSFCVFVKPTPRRPNSTFVSLQRLGPLWQGPELRLARPDAVGLRFPTVIGWSDFYGGTAAGVSVAWATDGTRTGYVVWGGTQGLRAVAEGEAPADDATGRGTFDERPLLWIDEAAVLPAEVVAVVGAGCPSEAEAARADQPGAGRAGAGSGEAPGARPTGDRRGSLGPTAVIR